MKIIQSEFRSKVNKLKGKSEFSSFIVDRVLEICKKDKHFSTIQLTESENRIYDINKKIKKQDSLIEQSKNIEKELTEKIASLDNASFSLKVKILEFLGSEL